MHARHGGQGDGLAALLWTLLPWALVLVAAALYGALVVRQAWAGRRWPVPRSLWFALGLSLLAAALSPALTAQAHADARVHMVQHLLTGMFAPLALTLAWPLTLTLRSLPVRAARRLTHTLHTPPLRVLTSPVTALGLNLGGLYLLYLTPLYGLMGRSSAVHALVTLHVFAAGLLYTQVVAGVEPLATRASFALRVTVLLLGTAAHATLAKLLYAGLWPREAGDTPEQLQQAARLMYYGGDLAEMLLAVLVFGGWYRQRGRAQSRTRRNTRPLPGTTSG